MRADALIVATAKVNGAGKFYSHDPKCRKMAAAAQMVSEDLPTHASDIFTHIETKQKEGDD